MFQPYQLIFLLSKLHYSNRSLFLIKIKTWLGRGIFALRDIETGFNIMTNEPYAYVISTEEKEDADLTHQLVTRVLLRLEQENGDSEKCGKIGDDLIAFTDLESNYDKLNQDQQHDVGVFLARFEQTKKFRWPQCVKSPKKLLDLCAQIKNNQFAINDESLNTEIGSAVYINASLLNHSSRPNAFPIFDGKTLYVKALKLIKPGEGKLPKIDHLFYLE